MPSNSSDSKPAAEAAGKQSLTQGQIAFARVLGAALAQRWQRRQRDQGDNVSLSRPENGGPDSASLSDLPPTSI
jgi:hypothetical protein